MLLLPGLITCPPLPVLFGDVLMQVEEIVMNELEILATEVIQEAQVDSIALVLL